MAKISPFSMDNDLVQTVSKLNMSKKYYKKDNKPPIFKAVKPPCWNDLDQKRLEALIEKKGLFEVYCICVEWFYKVDQKREPERFARYCYGVDYCLEKMTPVQRQMEQMKLIAGDK